MEDQNDAIEGAGMAQRATGLYRALVTLRVHHDRMLWSRVQFLIAVQGAVVAGSYAIGDHRLAAMFLLIGAGISLVIFALVTKDQLDRDANEKTMDVLGRLLLPERVTRQLQEEGCDYPYVRFGAAPPRWAPFVRARYLIRVVLWVVILADLILAILHLLKKAPVAQPFG